VLRDRQIERHVLDEIVIAVRDGTSRVLVIRGDPGVGKTALLNYLGDRAQGCRVAHAVGVQSEMELAFAGLHQLCAPLLTHLDSLPVPQRDALQTAFGQSTGPPPDRFLLGLAVLSLLSEAAGERPLICVVDDEQWLDHASAQTLGFVARRLAADPVGLVFAARSPSAELSGLPGLDLKGLREDDARALLDVVLPGPLDARVRDLIIAEAQGNPLALLELPRGLTRGELAGGFGLPGAGSVSGRIEASFRRQMEALPGLSQRLLRLVATDPSGDPCLVRQAARRLGIPAVAEAPAVEAGLVEFGYQVVFPHPLLRSVAYRSASAHERRELHGALAAVTDAAADPDRRAWHRAHATAGPDEHVAAELEDSASRAQARGGMAAAAAFLAHAVLLTVDRNRQTERALAAAQASVQAGMFEQAMALLVRAESGPLDDLQSARIDLLRGQVVFASGLGNDAPPLLLKAAGRLEPLDLELARETYLSAWMAALFAGHLADAGDLLEVSRAARTLPAPRHPPRPVDIALDGLTLLVTEGLGAAAPTLRRAARVAAQADADDERALTWGWLAQAAASAAWDDETWHTLLVRQVRVARDVGALDQLPVSLGALGTSTAWRGEFAETASLIAEADAICHATGSRAAPFAAMMLAALRGDEDEVVALVETTIAMSMAGGQGIAATYARWATAIFWNGHSRYELALPAAREAADDMPGLFVSMWALPELVEAAARCGELGVATDAFARLAEITRPAGTNFALGIEARARALVTEGAAAEDHYRAATDRLGRTRLRTDQTRSHLLYGEWLRRRNRRADARRQLRIAHEMASEIGMTAFAERARLELLATGETVRKRTVADVGTLTAQETSIARLAAEGRTNPEIGAQLFVSARTVEWHLRKVYTKLGIRSRRELRRALYA
jgi:DNA-binding CsgD family transcriptional regulator